MGLTLQTFVLFLKNLVAWFRKRWDRSTRRLLYILALLRTRFPPRHSKKGNEINRGIESRSVQSSPTTVICASRLPPPFTSIAGGDTPVIASPSAISIEVRQPAILNPEDALGESYEDGSTDNGDVDDYFQAKNSPIPGSPGFTNHSCHPPPNLNGAESAARGYLHERPPPRSPSPALSARTPSVVSSVASRVYRASRPTTRVRMPSPMANVPRHGERSFTPISVHQSVHGTCPGVFVPEFPRPDSRTTGSVHHDRSSVAVSSGSSLPPPPKGRLRPMVGINRYEKHKMVAVENVVKNHVCPPVTTQFLR